MSLLELAEEVKLDDPDTIAAINYLQTQNLISAERAVEILI